MLLQSGVLNEVPRIGFADALLDRFDLPGVELDEVINGLRCDVRF